MRRGAPATLALLALVVAVASAAPRGFVAGFDAARVSRAARGEPAALGGRSGRAGAVARRADAAQDAANLALFFLWGSPPPLMFSALFKRAEETLASTPAPEAAPAEEPGWLDGLFGKPAEPAEVPPATPAADEVEPRNMMWAFPSFGVLLEDEATEPNSMPQWVRWFFVFNVWGAIIWYLYYKVLVEEELRKIGLGIGGYLVIVPFALGLAGGIYGEWTMGSLTNGDPFTDVFSSGFYLGFLWIYVNQFFLYQKVNKLYTDEGLPAPLDEFGLVVPGWNFVTGIRQIHFLAEYWARKRGRPQPRDAFTDLFPFCTKETLTLTELLTTPSLWIRLDRLTGAAAEPSRLGN